MEENYPEGEIWLLKFQKLYGYHWTCIKRCLIPVVLEFSQCIQHRRKDTSSCVQCRPMYHM